MLRLTYCFLALLFLTILPTDGLSLGDDIQSLNTTNLEISVLQDYQTTFAYTVSSPRDLAGATINTNIFTLFNYNGSQIYVYSSFANENENKVYPHRWIFYYVPLMTPVRTSEDAVWAWAMNNEVRVKLMLGDKEVEHMARDGISKKFDRKTAEFAKYWDIAPLMIESLTAYVVTGSNLPVTGVQPYHSVHPNSLVLIFRFSCSTNENAQNVARMITSGEYEIEIAFSFDGFKRTSTSSVSITAEQLKIVASKTTADGGNTDAKYIHRNQASKFVGQYITNVKKIIYSENSEVDSQSLASGLEDQFIALLQQGNDLMRSYGLMNFSSFMTINDCCRNGKCPENYN
ncbi:unnamed protein product [Adineta ricciae]|uniref:Uncharacterized protein n=1 Tax=Adineta ricciae TaxID=249248 RepID=A0A816DKD0_ADIRI|nr:unnamed protein product [Adineta ricciae]